VSFSSQLPPPNPADPRYTKRGAIYVPAGQGPTMWAVTDTYTVKATATQTNGALGLIEASVPPGGGPEPHAHNDQDETFYMLSGELEFLDGDHAFTARAEDFVYVPRGIRHRFRNKGAHTAKMIFMWTPGGPEEVLLRYQQAARPGEQAPPMNPELVELYVELARRLNIDNLPDLS
jgi:quercetin dioxygenase-like cupin family protein